MQRRQNQRQRHHRGRGVTSKTAMQKWSARLPLCFWKCIIVLYTPKLKHIQRTLQRFSKGGESKQTQSTKQTRQQDRSPEHHTEAQHNGGQHGQAGHKGKAGQRSNPHQTTGKPATCHTGTHTRRAAAQHHRAQDNTAQRAAAWYNTHAAAERSTAPRNTKGNSRTHREAPRHQAPETHRPNEQKDPSAPTQRSRAQHRMETTGYTQHKGPRQTTARTNTRRENTHRTQHTAPRHTTEGTVPQSHRQRPRAQCSKQRHRAERDKTAKRTTPERRAEQRAAKRQRCTQGHSRANNNADQNEPKGGQRSRTSRPYDQRRGTTHNSNQKHGTAQHNTQKAAPNNTAQRAAVHKNTRQKTTARHTAQDTAHGSSTHQTKGRHSAGTPDSTADNTHTRGVGGQQAATTANKRQASRQEQSSRGKTPGIERQGNNTRQKYTPEGEGEEREATDSSKKKELQKRKRRGGEKQTAKQGNRGPGQKRRGAITEGEKNGWVRGFHSRKSRRQRGRKEMQSAKAKGTQGWKPREDEDSEGARHL